MTASLKDIGPLTRIVNVRGVDYEVCGIGVGDVFDLIVKYPALEKLMEAKVKDFNAAMILRQAPQAVGAIIALAIGKGNDEEEIALANKIGMSAQLTFLNPIFECTFSEGVGPFVDELRSLTAKLRMGKISSPEASAETSPAPLSGQLVIIGASRGPGGRLQGSSTRGSSSERGTVQ